MSIDYVDFRQEMYKLIDTALEVANNPNNQGDVHIEMEDDIDALFTKIKQEKLT